MVISPILRESVRTPLLRLPPDPVCYTFNLIRLPATDDAVGAGRLVTGAVNSVLWVIAVRDIRAVYTSGQNGAKRIEGWTWFWAHGLLVMAQAYWWSWMIPEV